MRPYRLVYRLILQQTLLYRLLAAEVRWRTIGVCKAGVFSVWRCIAPLAALTAIAVATAAFARFARLTLQIGLPF